MKTKINEVPKDNLLMVENGGIVVITLFKNVTEVSGDGFEADTVCFTLRPEANLREKVLAKFDWYWDRAIAVSLNEAKASKIIELKEQLAKTDYEAIKYAEGVISAESYTEMAAARAAWRAAINALPTSSEPLQVSTMFGFLK